MSWVLTFSFAYSVSPQTANSSVSKAMDSVVTCIVSCLYCHMEIQVLKSDGIQVTQSLKSALYLLHAQCLFS